MEKKSFFSFRGPNPAKDKVQTETVAKRQDDTYYKHQYSESMSPEGLILSTVIVMVLLISWGMSMFMIIDRYKEKSRDKRLKELKELNSMIPPAGPMQPHIAEERDNIMLGS